MLAFELPAAGRSSGIAHAAWLAVASDRRARHGVDCTMGDPGDETRTPAVRPQATLRRPVLCLADDDAELRELLGLMLRADGYEVHEVADGTELMEELSGYVRLGEWAAPLDLIIADVRMPGYSGLEVLERFRHENRDTPFLVLTAFTDSDVIARAARLGALVLRKPVELRQLQVAVRDLAPLAEHRLAARAQQSQE